MEQDRNKINNVDPMSTKNTMADSDDMQRTGRDQSINNSDDNSMNKESNTNWDENQSENAHWEHGEENDVERTTDNNKSDRSTSKIMESRQRATEKRLNKEGDGMRNYSDDARSFPIG